MAGWDDYGTDEATIGSGGAPVIDDGLYDAEIIEVGEIETRPNPFPQREGEKYYEETQTQFQIKLAITEEVEGFGEGDWYSYWINIPYGFRHGMGIGEKSKLYQVMTALGLIKPDQPVRFRPPEWVGYRCRVMVKDISTDGTPRCRVISISPVRGKKVAAAAKPGLRQRLTRPDDDLPEE